MSPAAISLLVYGIYIGGAGLGMVVLPGVVTPVLGLPAASLTAVRFVGVLAMALGFYDVLAARAGLTVFYRWSVYPRAGAFLAFTTLYVLGMAPVGLLVVGGVDALSAGWTWWALRDQR